MSRTTLNLFTPIQVGTVALQHRVVLAPMTRFRANKAHFPYLPLVAEFYGQRGSKPGTLLITEATFIAPQVGWDAHIPGIWSPEQIKAWTSVADAVHAKGCFLFMQLWALSPGDEEQQLQSEGSAVFLAGRSRPPHDLTVPEIKMYAALYAQAAKNAISAGCDGVEFDGANGYLVDQFLQDVSNKRTDEYGGSVENRARFALEIVDAVVAAVGAEHTAIRLSPWSPYQGMGMADPLPTFSYVISQLAVRHPTLAYLHLVEPRISGGGTRDPESIKKHESNNALAAVWAPRALVRTGGFTREGAIEAAEGGEKVLVGFGRWFLSNPDLPERLEQDVQLTPYDRSTFYLIGENSPRGYTDYPLAG